MGGDESCVVTAYADNNAANILSLPATVDAFAGECTGTGPQWESSEGLPDSV